MMKTHEECIRRCYELAVSAGKKGFDTFGAVLVHEGKILAEAENTADYDKGVFGHAEYNLVQKCMNQFPDHVLADAIFYTSTFPCVRCLMAIAALGIKHIAYGVSPEHFSKLLPFDQQTPDYETLLSQMGVEMHFHGPVLEADGMRVFEYWGGQYRKLEDMIAEMDEIKHKS